MTNSGIRRFNLGLALLVALPCVSRSQQCPDWSPYFNQIDDPVALQQLQTLRNSGWSNFNPGTNGGVSLQQGIQQLDQLIQAYQLELQQAQQAWLATSSGNAPMPKMNGTECRNSTGMGAAMAAACEVDNMHNAILAAQGTIDLARCRAGLPPGSTPSSLESTGLRSSPNLGVGSASGFTAWDQGAASVDGLNVSKRSGMVNSVKRNWQPPVEQEAPRDSLAQNASLADPFAESSASDSGTAAFTDQGRSGSMTETDQTSSDDSATLAKTTSSDPSIDSSATDAGMGNLAEASVNNAAVARLQEGSNSSETSSIDPDSIPQPTSDTRRSATEDSTPTLSSVPASVGSGSSSVIVAGTYGPDHSDTMPTAENSSNSGTTTFPQAARSLLEGGFSQTTTGQIVDDVQGMGSGDGQKQLDGMFDLADKGNDEYNANPASKFVVGKLLPLVHNAYSNTLDLLNATGQGLRCLTDPNCTSTTLPALEKSSDQFSNHLFSTPPANKGLFDQ